MTCDWCETGVSVQRFMGQMWLDDNVTVFISFTDLTRSNMAGVTRFLA